MSGEKRDFLVEIGTEELPPKALRVLEQAFAGELVSGLAKTGLKHGEVRSLRDAAAPRRSTFDAWPHSNRTRRSSGADRR